MTQGDEGCIKGMAVLLFIALAGLLLRGLAELVSMVGGAVVAALLAVLAVLIGASLVVFFLALRAGHASWRQRRVRLQRAAQLAVQIAAQRTEGLQFRSRVEALLDSSDRLLIDTNIWMEPSAHEPLRLLAHAAHARARPLVLASDRNSRRSSAFAARATEPRRPRPAGRCG